MAASTSTPTAKSMSSSSSSSSSRSASAASRVGGGTSGVGYVDVDGTGTGYSGTFRWKSSKVLPNMPPLHVPGGSHQLPRVDYSQGWMGYLLSRVPDDDVQCARLVKAVKEDLCYIDCLSSPVSVAAILHRTGLLSCVSSGQLEELHIVCMGCSEKAEERVMRESNCFQELLLGCAGVATVNLHLVGPELSHTQQNCVEPHIIVGAINQRLCFHLFQGTAIQFFRSHGSLLSANNVVVVGFNCGFGNFENPEVVRYNLLLNWLPDLMFLTATKLPLIFLCANDYADLVGEVGVMLSVCGARFLSPPMKNDFSFASTFVPERAGAGPGTGTGAGAAEGGADYSCGNSFWYAVCGCDKNRRLHSLQVLLKDPVAYQQNANSVRTAALRQVLLRLSKHDPPDTWDSYLVPPTPLSSTASPRSALLSTAAVQQQASSTLSATDENLVKREDTGSADVVVPLPSEFFIGRSTTATTMSPVNDVSHPCNHVRVTQQTNEESRCLTVLLEFSEDVKCDALSDIDVSVGSSGRRMLISVKLRDGSTFSSDLSLKAAVLTSTSRAKFNSKKRKLTYSATIASG